MEFFAPFSVVVLWYITTHGKGTAPGRLVAWLLMLIIVWTFVAISNPGAAGHAATAWALGIGRAAVAVGNFLSHFKFP